MMRLVPGFLKPELAYLELHLTDHCNLNCKGCTHFCPVAPTHYADLRQHEVDLHRLSQLFRNIRKIRLMGGEPLLHPDPVPFILATRAAFPATSLRFVTNGILLPKASDGFWEACRRTAAVIDWTVYPPMHQRINELSALCAAQGVHLTMDKVQMFFAGGNAKGTSDKQRAFHYCRSLVYCPFLRDGRLFHCSIAALIQHCNARFNTPFAVYDGIDIHSWHMTGRRILEQIRRPIETCRWCDLIRVPFTWEGHKQPELSDWMVEDQIKLNELKAAEPRP